MTESLARATQKQQTDSVQRTLHEAEYLHEYRGRVSARVQTGSTWISTEEEYLNVYTHRVPARVQRKSTSIRVQVRAQHNVYLTTHLLNLRAVAVDPNQRQDVLRRLVELQRCAHFA